MKLLVVSNDFPPKVGGIQTYHRELWSRFPAGEVTVLTTSHPDAAPFDAAQPYRVERVRDRVLLPTPRMAQRIRALAEGLAADLVVFDPELPIGALAPRLGLPYAVVIHGGVVVRAQLPGARRLLASVLRGARLVISAGAFPAAQARRAVGELPPVVEVPPGVDVDRFRPLAIDARAAARTSLGLPVDGRLVVSYSRLVPRKGMDVLIDAAALLAPSRPDLVVAIGGGRGNDRPRLERRTEASGAPVQFAGALDDTDLPRFVGCADVFSMLCRDAGLVKEGFGVVFAEAAAAGVPSVAGNSGGAADAVRHGETGYVVENPRDPVEAAAALARLLDDNLLRSRLGAAARARAESELAYDVLAARLRDALVVACLT